MSQTGFTAAGWRVDPAGRYRLRYWDGTHWTRWVVDGEQPFLDDAEVGARPIELGTRRARVADRAASLLLITFAALLGIPVVAEFTWASAYGIRHSSPGDGALWAALALLVPVSALAAGAWGRARRDSPRELARRIALVVIVVASVLLVFMGLAAAMTGF